jgi:hypothetical protein
MRLAPVGGAAPAGDPAGFLHAAQRDRRGRLLHADAGGELALGQPVLLPQDAQEVPGAGRDAGGREARGQRPLHQPVQVAHLEAEAVLQRQGHGAPHFGRFATAATVATKSCSAAAAEA